MQISRIWTALYGSFNPVQIDTVCRSLIGNPAGILHGIIFFLNFNWKSLMLYFVELVSWKFHM